MDASSTGFASTGASARTGASATRHAPRSSSRAVARARDEFGNSSQVEGKAETDILVVRDGDRYRVDVASILFKGYTDDEETSRVGIGASAISETPEGYAQNLTAIPDWQRAVFAGRLPVAKMRALSPEDRLRRRVINDLMCDRTVDLEALQREQGYLPDHLADCVARLEEPARDGLVAIDGHRIRVTDRGWPFMRNVAAAFDAYLAPDEMRHARAV